MGQKNRIVGFPEKLALISFLLIIIGLILNCLTSWKGVINLEPDSETRVVQILKGNSKHKERSLELPFSIRLNNFEKEELTSEFNIVMKEMDKPDNPHTTTFMDDHNVNEEPKRLATFSLEQGKIHHLAGTKYNFRLNEFYPDFGFKYDYPITVDTIEPVDPGIMLELIIGESKLQLQLRANQNSTLYEPHLEINFEFYWDVPKEILGLNHHDELVSDSILNKIVFVGKTQEVIYVFSDHILSQALKRGKTYFIPGKKDMGFHFQFIFPDAKYISATPGTSSKELNNPVAKVEIWDPKQYGSESAFLFQGKGGSLGMHQLKGSSLALALEKTSHYQLTSYFSIIDTSNTEVRQIIIQDDNCIQHEGYCFYHLDRKNDDMKYPGLIVSKSQGIPLIYIGLGGLFLSFIGLYFSPRKGG